MKKTLIGIIVLAIVAAGGWYLYTKMPATPTVSGDVVATVNGEEISREEFETLEAKVIAGQGVDASILPAEVRTQLQTEIINALITQKLLSQAVEDAGITASSTLVDAQLNLVKSQFPDQAAYQQILDTEGLTEAEFKEQISQEIATQEYLQQKLNLSAVTATDAEVQAEYNKVASSTQETVPPLAEVRTQVAASVIQQKQQQLVLAHVEALKADADIEITL